MNLLIKENLLSGEYIMALTQTERKKLLKLEKSIADAEKERNAIIDASAKDIAQTGIKFGLWQLDKKILGSAFYELAQKYKLQNI